jgi:hypothetical protein
MPTLRYYSNSTFESLTVFFSHGFFKAASFLLYLILVSCSLKVDSSRTSTFDSLALSKNSAVWLSSGTISLGGVVELVLAEESISGEDNYLNQAYGFSNMGLRSLVIETKSNKATLFVSGKESASAQLLDVAGLKAGTYTLAHKQRNPLWYAPQEYFSARGMPVPSEGDKNRFLRGAYGDFALFIDAETAIHSGPFDLEELTGARCEEKDMSKIFYSLEIGDSIQIIN